VIEEALNGVIAKLSQAALTDLNKQVTVDGKAAAEVAAAWISAEGLSFSGGSGSVTVGSTNFYEQEILGEVFAQVLEGAGITSRENGSGPRMSSRPSRPARSTSWPSTRRRPSSTSTRRPAKRPPTMPPLWPSSGSGWRRRA
jgi:hypothetical protein